MLAADAVCSTQQEVAAAVAAHIGSKATASMPAEECCLRKVGQTAILQTWLSLTLPGATSGLLACCHAKRARQLQHLSGGQRLTQGIAYIEPGCLACIIGDIVHSLSVHRLSGAGTGCVQSARWLQPTAIPSLPAGG